MALREALEEFDHQLSSWARAYPESVFPEPDMTLVRTALEARGITIDAVSASNMRHVATTLNKLFEPVRRSSSSGAGDAAVETVLFNGLTAAETDATASVAGLPIKQEMPEAVSKVALDIARWFINGDRPDEWKLKEWAESLDRDAVAKAYDERAVIAQKGKGERD